MGPWLFSPSRVPERKKECVSRRAQVWRKSKPIARRVTALTPFLSSTQWEAEVKKMINVMGAPINEADAKAIVEYLSTKYGS